MPAIFSLYIINKSGGLIYNKVRYFFDELLQRTFIALISKLMGWIFVTIEEKSF